MGGLLVVLWIGYKTIFVCFMAAVANKSSITRLAIRTDLLGTSTKFKVFGLRPSRLIRAYHNC